MENSSTEFIDIHNAKESFEKTIEGIRKNKSIITKNRELILRFINDARTGKTVKDRAKKKISYSRCMKYAYGLKRFSNWFGKPFDSITLKDMERVINWLEEDKYTAKTIDGKSKKYSESTKLDYKKTIRKFFKWMYGENKKFFELTSWIDTYEQFHELPALTREEIEKMASSCNIRDKAIIMILFDSGARIEEFLNLRMGDSTRKEDDNYYMIRIKHSKTKPRTISIPMCTEVLDNWLLIHPARDDPNAQLFPLTYDAVRMVLKRIGRKIIKKNVYPHLLRHSSVTYYCHKLSQYQLCYRYGWSMSSKQPARYIDREGINEEETAEMVKSDDISKLKKEIQKVNENYASLREENVNLRKVIDRVSLTAKVINRLKKRIPDFEQEATKVIGEMVARGEVSIP